MDCYIFDLDGTLCDISHRLHFIQKEKADWAAFYAACSDDKPIEHMLRLCFDLIEMAKLVFVSGRSDECRAATEAWLDKHLPSVVSKPLYMRKAGDFRQDYVVKLELMEQVKADGYRPLMVFEDRYQVVQAWRAAGIPCAQVAEGDF